jgi:hypothetical protein
VPITVADKGDREVDDPWVAVAVRDVGRVGRCAELGGEHHAEHLGEHEQLLDRADGDAKDAVEAVVGEVDVVGEQGLRAMLRCSGDPGRAADHRDLDVAADEQGLGEGDDEVLGAVVAAVGGEDAGARRLGEGGGHRVEVHEGRDRALRDVGEGGGELAL